MTNRTEAGAEKSFISTLLPWIIAGAVAILYLFTVNHWISASVRYMHVVARTTGQTWTAESYAPLFVLVTSPFHWLPEASVPLALNLFSVVCAFFILVLLARCVVLMPQDRTEKQREKGRSALLSLSSAWVPPVMAVLVFGLQLTFWENATALSQGMLDLLLFAYSVRCLLEYRVEKRESWLLRATVIYAAAAADSWLFVALSPFFLGAIIWMMGLSFFQLRFVSRLFLCTLVGALLFCYLPLLHLRDGGPFWQALKDALANELYPVKFIFRYLEHYVQLFLVLTSLLPIIVIGIRWKSSFGDSSHLGAALATWILHLAHLALLVVCVWAAFDTSFSLRDPSGRYSFLSQNRDTFLPLYFLSALSIGYIAGYFLLVFKPLVRRGRSITSLEKFLSRISTAAIYAVLVLAPVGLICKNLPTIRYTNGPMLQNYAAAIVEKLPPNAVLLSDTQAPLLLTHSWLARTGKAQNFLFLDTSALKSLAYYRFQTRLHPEQWPKVFTDIPQGDAAISYLQLAQIVRDIAKEHPVYYLHPSFGYYFDVFYPVPHGLVSEMRMFTTNMVAPPPLPETVFTENETFWKQHEAELATIPPGVSAAGPEQKPGFRERWMNNLQIPYERNVAATFLGLIYSRTLNNWGVTAQQMGHLESAGSHFDQALRLAPGNIVASANLDFNKKLRKGERITSDNPAAFEERFGSTPDWNKILNNGQVDEPIGCLAQGIFFKRGDLDRQAAQNLLRSLALAPDGVLARLWLSRVYVILNQPEKALTLINELKSRSKAAAEADIYPSDILQVELAANYVNKSQANVDRIVRTTVAQKPPDPILLDTAVQVATFYRDYTNALVALERQSQVSPDNVTILINQGFLRIQLTNYTAAIPPLSKAISLSPTNTTAIFCRAVCNFELGNLDESQHDYELLRKINPKGYAAYHGLAEIALRKKDTNTARLNYQLDFTNSPPNSPEANWAIDRLKKLTNSPP